MSKGVGLISGGLDSILAARVLIEQGIEVIGVSFITPFFGAEGAKVAAARLGIPLTVIDITERHLKMLRSPRYGYGGGMNPCLDCHILMLQEAGRLMVAEGADFLFTGEVLGQRPMSQNKGALRLVEKGSGYEGRILRPLSARLLPETIPEQEGLVNRERLLAISGRSRRVQLELAERYGIEHYQTPAGGCLLTDPIFARRLRDLFSHQDQPEVRDIELLKVGRHLRLSPGVKLIVGRNAQENERIAQLVVKRDVLLKVKEYPGPLCLIPGGYMDSIDEAAAICLRYSDAPKTEEVAVLWKRGDEEGIVMAHACLPSRSAELMI